MSFKAGHKLARGRPPGSKNIRTLEVEMLAQESGINPFELLLLFAKGDWKALGYDSEVYVKETAQGSTSIGYTIPPELRAQCARDACQYLYSKKKSIEHVQSSALEGMTPEQKLEAMKQAVKMMEGELDRSGGLSREVKGDG